MPDVHSWGYESRDFLDALNELDSSKYVLGLTKAAIGRFYFIFDSDMCNGIIPLYGSTDERTSIISSSMDSNFEYTTSTVMHELGHQFGLWHCDNDNCVMATYGPNSSLMLCRKCKKLYRHVGRLKK